MSRNPHKVFAALGDETRLKLVSRLCAEGPMSIAKLSEGSKVTRQAITKHLRVMEEARLLHCRRRGRETLWTLDERRLDEARRALAMIAEQWDDALARLKKFVED
ncbi:MAG: metalloregulator ArsR/SmtB family transcription factor [Acidobacteriia bacterium]|nr:metalloregulator ArsR/SmtB family transcription factor [Terriglobia bacterium]